MCPPGPKDSSLRPQGAAVLPGGPKGRLVVIGNFDGVHRGHQWVLERAHEESEKRGLRLSVLTFDPHPAVVLGRSVWAPLTTTPTKRRLLTEVATELEVLVEPFTRKLAGLRPEEFAQVILRDQLDARVVLVGENFKFGADRAGDLECLKRLGQNMGFEAWAESLRGDQGGTFSSTRTRELLREGKVEEAAQVLGRPHTIYGRVIHGDKRGREMGFPTANLGEVHEVLPVDGVYAVEVSCPSKPTFPRSLLGVANIGARPTVGQPHAIEVHLIGFEGDLYGQVLGVAILHRLRSVQKFDGIEALKRQIATDIAMAGAGGTRAAPTESLR